MKRLSGLIILTAMMMSMQVTDSRAAGNAYAKIMLHALSPTAKAACARDGLRPSTCAGFVTNNLSLYPEVYYAYVLVVEGSLTEGVAGAQFGINYPGPANGATDGDGLEIYDWTRCATMEIQTPPGGGINPWPNPGSGILLAWDPVNACQRTGNYAVGAVAVAGYFYCGSYDPTTLRIVPRQIDGVAKVANCASVEDIIYTSPVDDFSHLGSLGFGQPGNNPCGRLGCGCSPVVPTTWSAVKTQLD